MLFRSVFATVQPQLSTAIQARIDAAAQQAAANAATAAELGLHVSRMLDRTNDCTDEIMASVERSNEPKETNPTIALRTSLENTLAMASLPRPSGHVSLPPAPTPAT